MTNGLETQSPRAFIGLCIGTLVAGAALLAYSFPWWSQVPHNQAAYLRNLTQTASTDEQLLLNRFATWFDHDNPDAHIAIAQASLKLHDPSRGLRELKTVPPTPASEFLRAQLLLEDGQATTAADALAPLAADSAAAEPIIVLACLAQATAGQQAACLPFTSRVSSPEATTSVLRAQGDKTTLASALYANGLVLSAQRVLSEEPVTPSRNLLLARIHYDIHTTASLQKASDLLVGAIRLDPAGIEAHKLLQAVYQDLDDSTGAASQADMISRLSNGRP